MSSSGNTSKADTVGRMAITDKADFKVKVRASCANCKTTLKKSEPSTKSHLSNMPRESAFTYSLINIRYRPFNLDMACDAHVR